MTQEECRELLNTLMTAVNKVVDARLNTVPKSALCAVRYLDDGDVYVRPYSDISTPTYASPSSVSQLDDGDIKVVNISGQVLNVGDNVEVIYTASIADAAIIRKLSYTVVDPTRLRHDLTIEQNSGYTGVYAERTDTGAKVSLGVSEDGYDHGVFSHDQNQWLIYGNGDGKSRIPNDAIIDGSVTVSDHSSPIGTVKTVSLDVAKSIATSTAIDVLSITLEAGTWIIIARARFSENATGYRRINIKTDSASTDNHMQVAAVDGGVTQMALSRVVSLTSTATYYLNAFQNSGSTLTMPAGSAGNINALIAVRIA